MSIRYTKDGMQTSKTLKQDRYKYVEADLLKKFNDIIGVLNAKRIVFFDAFGTSTTLDDKSSNNQDASLSLAANSLDPAFSGNLRILNFNDSSADYWQFADAADLQFGNAGTDLPFSVIFCGSPNDANGDFIAKYSSGTSEREWRMYCTSSKLSFDMRQAANSANFIGRTYSTAITGDIGRYVTYISTYAGTKAESGIKIYRNGARVDDTSASGGTFPGLTNTNALVGCFENGVSTSRSSIKSAKYAFVAIVSIELSEAQIVSIDRILRSFVGVI